MKSKDPSHEINVPLPLALICDKAYSLIRPPPRGMHASSEVRDLDNILIQLNEALEVV